jgi:sulfonate transport system permease protein
VTAVATSKGGGKLRALSPERALPFVLPALVLGAWTFVSTTGRIPEYSMPGPKKLVLECWDFVFGTLHLNSYAGTFLTHALASLHRVGLGFLLATVFGVPFGVISGSSARFERFLGPTVHTIRSVPGITWLPLAMVWFGIGDKTSIFLVALASFFPVYLNSVQGAASIRPVWRRAALMLGANRRTLLTTVVLPGAMPSIVAGLRLGLGLSWAYVVLGELSGVPFGLGAVIMDARMQGEVSTVMVGMVYIALIGRLCDRLLLLVLGRLAWRKEMVQ